MMKRFLTFLKDIIVGKPASLRSSKWETVRKHWLEAHPTCAACGTTQALQVHHIQPFHIHPDLELDTTNLITLCEVMTVRCHLHIGHNGNWKRENPDVVLAAKAALEKTGP